MSKGSWRRPCNVPKKVHDENWDRIFGKRKKENGSKKEKKEREERKQGSAK